MPSGGYVPVCLSPVRHRIQSVDRIDQARREHRALNEDALGHRIDGTEHLAVFPIAKQLDRLVVVEGGIGRKEPVMRRVRFEDTGEPIEHSEELENALSRIWPGRRLTMQPMGGPPRA